MKELVIVRTYPSRLEAELAGNILKSQGIACVLQAGTVGQSGYPLGGNANLVVSTQDFARAKEFLDSYSA